jgi:hypothetical protein
VDLEERRNFDKFAAFVVELEERRTSKNLQCLLWILRENFGKSAVFVVDLEERRNFDKSAVFDVDLKRELRKICSVCCGA